MVKFILLLVKFLNEKALNKSMEIEDLIKLISEGESDKVEFKENVSNDLPKKIAAFANTDGGFIIIGVNDEGKIIGIKDVNKATQKINDFLLSINPVPKVKIKKFELDKKQVIIIEVEKSNVVHAVRNVVYIRIGRNLRPLTIEETSKLLLTKRKINWDDLASDVPLEKANFKLIEFYFKKRKEMNLPLDEEFESNLIKCKIVKEKNGKLFLTNAAVLCFTDDPNIFIQGSKIRIAKFKDELMKEFADYKEFYGPVWKQIDLATDYLKEKIERYGIKTYKKRLEFDEYPLIAVKEAITNAIAHKNYLVGSSVQIKIFPNKMEIINPGSLPQNLNLERPEHIPVNPLLCDFLWTLGYIEKFGSGLIFIREECKKHPLVNFYITSTPNYTKAVFKKEKTEFDELSKSIIQFLSKPATLQEIIDFTGKSKPTVIERLKFLRSLGIIKEVREGKKKKFYVNIQ